MLFLVFFGLLAIPILLLVGSNVTDYITGLMASKYRSNPGWDSKTGIKGIFKKIGIVDSCFGRFHDGYINLIFSYTIRNKTSCKLLSCMCSCDLDCV